MTPILKMNCGAKIKRKFDITGSAEASGQLSKTGSAQSCQAFRLAHLDCGQKDSPKTFTML